MSGSFRVVHRVALDTAKTETILSIDEHLTSPYQYINSINLRSVCLLCGKRRAADRAPLALAKVVAFVERQQQTPGRDSARLQRHRVTATCQRRLHLILVTTILPIVIMVLDILVLVVTIVEST